MVWIIVTGDTTEEGNISFGEGTSKGEGLTYLYGVKGDLQLLFELWTCFWHKVLPDLFSFSFLDSSLPTAVRKRDEPPQAARSPE